MDAVILAGGHSRRMGRDKATLEFDGARLVERVHGRLGTVADRIVVARGSQPSIGVAEEIPDVPWASGPIAGIVAALEVLTGDHVALIGVDMPDVSPAILQRLVHVCELRDRSAGLPRVDGQSQPLHSVVSRAGALALIAVARAGERSPRRALGRIDACVLDVDGWADLDAEGRFATDLDTPADLRR